METENFCLLCLSPQALHTFPCRKSFCWPCIVDYTFSMLKTFDYKLQNELQSIQGKASYLSCLHDCEECRVSLSLMTVERHLEGSRLTDPNKQRFRELSIIGRSFFSGIKTKFYKCLNCKTFFSRIGENPFLCKQCIINLIYTKSQIRPKSINYVWQNTNDEILNSDYMGENFEILYFNEESSSYDFIQSQDYEGNIIHIIERVRNILNKQYILIVRIIQHQLSDDERIIIESHRDDIKMITLVTVTI